MARQNMIKASEAPRFTTTMAEEIDCMGKDFTAKFYDALLGMPDALPLNRFYERQSIYLRADGRPKCEAARAERIDTLVARLKTERHTVVVASVYTVQIEPRKFSVVTCGRMSQAGRPGTHGFVHSTVMTTPSSAAREYTILRTSFKFVDPRVDQHFFGTAIGYRTELVLLPTAANGRGGGVRSESQGNNRGLVEGVKSYSDTECFSDDRPTKRNRQRHQKANLCDEMETPPKDKSAAKRTDDKNLCQRASREVVPMRNRKRSKRK